jgi:hypothetical protein
MTVVEKLVKCLLLNLVKSANPLIVTVAGEVDQESGKTLLEEQETIYVEDE